MRNSSALFLISLALSIFTVYTHDGHDCIHDNVEHKFDFLDVEEQTPPEGEGRLLANATIYPNINIYPYFDTLAGAPADFISYIQNELVPPVISFFQGALHSKYPTTAPIKLSQSITTLCDIPTPTILQAGVTTDFFMMFVSENNLASNYAATATYCFLSSTSKRPVIGRTMFNQKYVIIPNGDILQQEMNTYTLMHEMIHAFGFSSGLFPYWLDDFGVRRTGHIITMQKYGSTPSTILNITSLTTKVRSFFGCSTLEGLYLENNGGSATAGSHMERRQFAYELMSSGSMQDLRLSQFSLMALEASGWYQANYTFAEPYFFGQGTGCSFLNNQCNTTSFVNTFSDEFCQGSARACTPQGRGGGVCASDSNTDGCSFVHPYAAYDCDNPDSSAYARYPDLQVFGRGLGSKCFEANLTLATAPITFTSFCFKYTCSGTGTNTTLQVQAGSSLLTCTKESQIPVPGYHGVFNCPDPVSYCTTIGKHYCPRNCMNQGKCVSNKCYCNKGWTGIDCGLMI